MRVRFPPSNGTAYLRPALRSQKGNIYMHKRQPVFCPNQIIHDLVVIVDHYVLPHLRGVPAYLSGRAPGQQNNGDREIRIQPLAFDEQSGP